MMRLENQATKLSPYFSFVNISKYITAITVALMLSPSRSGAQSYTVGIPVDSILFSFFLPSNTCGEDYSTSITFLPSTVTGVTHVLRVIQALPPNTTIEQMAGTVNTGDTFLITQAQNNFVFVTPIGASFGITIRAVGTPLHSGEDYGCELLFDDYIYDGCRFTYNALGYYDTCNVAPAPAVEELNGNGISIYPVPITSWFKITGAPENAIISITDITGKIILRQILNETNTFYLDRYSPGLYLLNIQDEEKMYWKKIIKY